MGFCPCIAMVFDGRVGGADGMGSAVGVRVGKSTCQSRCVLGGASRTQASGWHRRVDGVHDTTLATDPAQAPARRVDEVDGRGRGSAARGRGYAQGSDTSASGLARWESTSAACGVGGGRSSRGYARERDGEGMDRGPRRVN